MPLSRDRPHLLRSWREWLRRTLDAAFMDLLPWLLMSWIGGSGRVLVGACVGLLLTALAVILRGLPWRLLQLEALATVTFFLFLVMALLAPASSQDWLAEHADQLSDSLFMAFVLGEICWAAPSPRTMPAWNFRSICLDRLRIAKP